MLTALWLVGGMGMLASCSNDNGRGPDSEMRVDAPAASVETKAPARGEVPPAGTEEPAGALTAAGRRYRVAVETAYFFDKPEQSAPNGRYLRRSDTFYGEGETNGFVKTGFVLPNGSAGTAWLKVQGLTSLAENPPAPRSGRSSSAPVPQPADEEMDSKQPAPSGSRQRPAAASPSGATTAVVQAGRAYSPTPTWRCPAKPTASVAIRCGWVSRAARPYL